MDAFDSIDLAVSAVFLPPVLARMTFWKRNGRLLNFHSTFPDFLLVGIGALELSVIHHWHAPRRSEHQWTLAVSAVVIGFYKLVVEVGRERKNGSLNRRTLSSTGDVPEPLASEKIYGRMDRR